MTSFALISVVQMAEIKAWAGILVQLAKDGQNTFLNKLKLLMGKAPVCDFHYLHLKHVMHLLQVEVCIHLA